MQTPRQQLIRSLFDNYIELYAARDVRLTALFSDNFTGYAGSSDVLVSSRDEWLKVTLQDFAQVPGRLRIDLLDIALQDLSADVVTVTAFFHIHLPTPAQFLARETARLVLVFRNEGEHWKIAHSGISIPFNVAQSNEVYPLGGMLERNRILELLVEERSHALEASEKRFRDLVDSTSGIVWEAEADSLTFTYVSREAERLFGFSVDDWLHPGFFREHLHPDDVSWADERFASCANHLEVNNFEYRLLAKDGRRIWLHDTVKVITDNGVPRWLRGVMVDITAIKGAEDALHHMAEHDQLTGLANRVLFNDRLQRALACAHRDQTTLGLLFVDLDKFKPVNDQYGHGVGDLLLQEVAWHLQACIRDSDTAARIGGDEFVVLLRDVAGEPEALAAAEKIRVSLEQPYETGGYRLNISSCVGVAVYPQHGEDPVELLKNADKAMYAGKSSGRNLVNLFVNPVK